MRLGDWVEINGVSGEVIELSMFHTVLLETGNWTDAGHPTGRRVTFTNSFAIEGHYFNFSTSGSGCGMSSSVMVPYGRDRARHRGCDRKGGRGGDRRERPARPRWSGSAPRAGSAARGFTRAARRSRCARPAGGVEIAVRYVTRASERSRCARRLYQIGGAAARRRRHARSMSERCRRCFVGHGNPMNALQENAWTRAWAELGARAAAPARGAVDLGALVRARHRRDRDARSRAPSMTSAASRASCSRCATRARATPRSPRACRRCSRRCRSTPTTPGASITAPGRCCVTCTRRRMYRWCS